MTSRVSVSLALLLATLTLTGAEWDKQSGAMIKASACSEALKAGF